MCTGKQKFWQIDFCKLLSETAQACTNKFLIGGLIGVDVSSIAYEAVRITSSLFIFVYEKILSVKKASKRKQTIFTLLEAFVRAKNGCLCWFLFA